MTRLIGRIDAAERTVRRISTAIAKAGVALLVIYSFATVVDVALRALTGRPIHGFEDVATLVIPVIAASFLPHVTICRANARVDILGRSLGARSAARLDAFGHLALFVFLSIAAAQFTIFAIDARDLTTMILRAPMIPSFALVSLLLLFSAIAQGLVIVAGGRGEKPAATLED